VAHQHKEDCEFRMSERRNTITDVHGEICRIKSECGRV
jgi:hypothetical protein